MEDALKILKVEYISNHFMDRDLRSLGEIRGNLECGSAQPSLCVWGFHKYSPIATEWIN